jgi:poly-gamma-glutamate capsule biosynthesis protein CapA/YwtB (metallophosphatase superfamily)
LKHTQSLLTCFFVFLFLFSSCKDENIKKNNKQTLKNEKTEVTEKSVQSVDPDSVYSVIMVGDMMLGTNYPSESSLPFDDGKTLLDDPKEVLLSADVTIGNLEGTLLNKGGTPKECADPSNCVAFRMPEHYAGYIKDAGFDMMNIANNHSGDMGDIGRKSTQNTLKEYGIKFAGQLNCSTAVFVKDGIKFGLAGFAPNNGTVSIHDLKNAARIVKELKKECNIVIVAFHGGAEGSGSVRVPRRNEMYLGENRGDVYEFAHAVIDAGADVVFGQGPHVPRGVELYKDKFIAYSLGNFCTYGKFGLSGNLGLAPILKLYINKEGNFERGRIFPFRQIKRGVPVYDDSFAVVELIKRMTETDFPETTIEISSDGKITKK